MPLIIDTWNVLHVTGILPPELAGLDLVGLIDLLRDSRYRRDRVTLVCDGAPPTHMPSTGGSVDAGVVVRFSGTGREADEVIRQMIRSSTVPRRLTVVSSDHEILRAARRRRCQVLRSEEFLANLARDAGRPGPLSREPGAPTTLSEAQVEQWKDLFGVDEQDERAMAREVDRQMPTKRSPGQPSTRPGSSRPGDHAKSPANLDAPSDQPAELPEHGPPLPKSIIEEAEAIARELDAEPPHRRPAGGDSPDSSSSASN